MTTRATEEPGADLGSRRRGWRPSGAATAALLVGLLVTAALSLTTSLLRDHNEHRLLRLRARELSLVLTAIVPSIQTPLASAAELADATHGDPQKFRRFMGAYVGPGREFSSASLWGPDLHRLRPTAVIGTAPAMASRPKLALGFFRRARRTAKLSVVGLLSSSPARLGYEFSTPGTTGGFAAYAESPLPADRRSKTASGQGFSDLHYALYLGRSRAGDQLLVTDVAHPPLSGRTASTVVPFGDRVLDLVVSPKGSLGGGFFGDLPWVIALFGSLISIAAALMPIAWSGAAVMQKSSPGGSIGSPARTAGCTTSSARSHRPCSMLCFPPPCRSPPGSRPAPATCRPPPASTSAAIGMTC
jgi:hypothetical protein